MRAVQHHPRFRVVEPPRLFQFFFVNRDVAGQRFADQADHDVGGKRPRLAGDVVDGADADAGFLENFAPRRVLDAFGEFYSGYGANPSEVLDRTFEDVGAYDDIVLVRDIDFYSHCEHHMVPFIGRAHVAYFPTEKVVGLSKHLLFFDARDPRQVVRARQLIDVYQGRVKPILVAGSYLDLMKSWKLRVYYDQEGVLVRKFGITAVPAIVSQEGQRLRIDEVLVQ